MNILARHLTAFLPIKSLRLRQIPWPIFGLALITSGQVTPGNQAHTAPSNPSKGIICAAQERLARFDPNFTMVADSNFEIVSDDLKIKIKSDTPIFYEGKPFQNSAPQLGVYGRVHVSDKFYGVEKVLHYALLRGGTPYGGIQVQEHVTVLYENMLRKPFRPRVFDSKPFTINRNGTFQDRQVMGHFDTPWPDNAIQILKQELILDEELVATIYILRTIKDILVVGYSVPPLISNSAVKTTEMQP